LFTVLGDEGIEDLLRGLALGTQGEHFAMETGRVGAGEVGGSTGEDVQGTAAVARQPLLDRLDLRVVLARVRGWTGPAHRGGVRQRTGGATTSERVLHRRLHTMERQQRSGPKAAEKVT